VPSHKCLEILSAVGDAFNSPVDTRELLERTSRAVVEHLGLKGCQFSLLSQDQQLLDHIASSGLGEGFLERGPVEVAGLADVLEGKPLVIPDCRSDPRVQYPKAHSSEGLVSSLAVPLKTRGQVIGVVQAYAGESRDFSDTDVKLMQVLAAFCARAVTHSMFHKILDSATAAIRSSLSLEQALESVARLGATIFQIAVHLALPITAAMVVSNVAVGILGRAIPQLNLMALQLPAHVATTLLILGLGAAPLTDVIARTLESATGEAIGAVLGVR